eukprot:1125410-Alexandrium_andersonii.AAC.1
MELNRHEILGPQIPRIRRSLAAAHASLAFASCLAFQVHSESDLRTPLFGSTEAAPPALVAPPFKLGNKSHHYAACSA